MGQGVPAHQRRKGDPIDHRTVMRGTSCRRLVAWLRLPVHGLLAGLMLCVGLPQAWALDPGKPFRDYVSDSWDMNDGLPQTSVLAITQDSRGYLWFGTQGGLARFDGVRFIRYSQRDAAVLAGPVQALQADAAGRIWIGTSQGLAVHANGRLRTFDTAGGAALPSSVWAFAATTDGMLVGTPEGVYAATDGRLTLRHPLTGPALSLLQRDDGLWVGSQGQVFRIGSGGTQPLALPDDAHDARVVALAHAHGQLWAGTSLGLLRLEGGRWVRDAGDDGLGGTPVEALHADRAGNLWVATPHALHRIADGQPRERIEGTPGGIAPRALHEDRDGSLWIGSMVQGVTRVWSGWTRRIGEREGLENLLLWSVAQAPDGQLWLGGGDGVGSVDPASGQYRRRIDGALLPHPEAYSLLAEAGRLWIGTRNGAALYQDGRLQTPPLLASMHGAQVNSIVRDLAGRLWFGTSQGLFLQEGEALRHYGEAEGLGDPRVRIVHELRDGRILLGTQNGLYEWRDGRILATGALTGLGESAMIGAIHELPDGRWLIGAAVGEELRLYDGRTWTRLGIERGVPANQPFFIGESAGHLWVAGMRGVYRIPMPDLLRAATDPDHRIDAEAVINSGMDRPDGQRGKCCNGAGSSRGLLLGRMLWLPSRDGALVVDTGAAPFAREPADVLVERLQVQGQWRIPQDGSVALGADERDLKFEFTTPTFQPMRPPLLRYRLRGYDAHWREPDDQGARTATYTNLPPGQYLFEVADLRRQHSGGGIAQLGVRIAPRLHETLLFRISLCLLLAGLPYLGYRWLRGRYARQRAALEHLVQERTRDLQAANARLEAISFTDPLTGLRNRRYLARQIPSDLAFYEREPGFVRGEEAAVFALLDVDHFKQINDVHGHAAGDRVLEQLAQVLSEMVRGGDYVCRWGGEEFLLVFRPQPRGQLPLLGERICERVRSHRFDLGAAQAHRLTVSIGLVEHPLFADSPDLLGWEQMVTLADRALYAVKAAGRNSWAAYRPRPGTVAPAELLHRDGDPCWIIDEGLLLLEGPTIDSRPIG